MSIELSPKEYWKELRRDDAWLYCVTLTHNNKYNWRFPTYRELMGNESTAYISILGEWYAADLDVLNLDNLDDLYCIVPVRDRRNDD